MIDQRIGSLPYELNWIACIPLLLPLFGKNVGLDRMFLKRLGNLSSIRVADFVVALALKTIGSIIPAYIGHRLDISCEHVGVSCAFAYQGVSCCRWAGERDASTRSS